MKASEPATDSRWYGRRRGKKLRPGRQALVDDLLPRLRIDPAALAGQDLSALFPKPVDDLWLEIGFGAGEHLAAQAARHPETGFIGCEPFVNGVASLLTMIEEGGLKNVLLFDDDARLLLDHLPAASIGRIFILFNDPWPKKRHHRRRFVSPHTVECLARLLKDDGEILFASDHMGYIAWALEHFLRGGALRWLARRPSDWRRPPDGWVATRYEKKARKRGANPVFLRFARLPRSP